MAQNRLVTTMSGMTTIMVLAAVMVGKGQEGPGGWYQWGGPTRNFHVASAPLADVRTAEQK